MTTTPETNHAEQNAKGWISTIREHLACLECDRERLEELRDVCASCPHCGEDIAKGQTTCPECVKPIGLEEEFEELRKIEEDSKIDGEEHDEEEARARIEESPLSVEVRDGWKSPGAESEGPEEFCILLTTGGPALRIMGDLDSHCQPTRAYLQYQDWGTPWTDYYEEGIGELLLKWASVFYFGA